MRPSDLLDIPRTPSTSNLRFSIDEAVVDFMEWVEGKANEKKIGKADGPQPDSKKHETWVPKYASLADILAEYEGADDAPDVPRIADADMAELIADMEAHVTPEF